MMQHKAKKSLGQNFLKSKGALLAMCKAGELFKSDIVLEIGPGKGALTEHLLKSVNKVIAVEKDYNLCTILSEKFKSEITSGHLVLVRDDILKFDPAFYFLPTTCYKIIANIPYNITGAIFKKFLTANIQPERMVLLVQKEVAERIVARDGKESILSISVKAYGTPKYIMKVIKKFFSPQPKVDSAILQITNISRENFSSPALRRLELLGKALEPECDDTRRARETFQQKSIVRGLGGGELNESKFFEILKAGFAHKRKVLIKNLEQVCERGKLAEIFTNLNISTKIRAEDIPLDIWLAIAGKILK